MSGTNFETSAGVREHLLSALRGDVFGPDTRHFAHDDHMANRESLRPGIRPSSFYLFGFLVPADEVAMVSDADEKDLTTELLGEEQDDANAPAQDDEDGGRSHVQNRRIQPSSLGLTVFVDPDCQQVDTTVRFANYIPEPPISQEILKGSPKSIADEISWKRDPRTIERSISRDDIDRALETPGGIELLLDGTAAPSLPGGGVVLHIVAQECRLPRPADRRDWPRAISLTVFVVNKRTAANRFKNVSNIFQAGLTLETPGGFIGNPDMSGFAADDFDLRLHDLHYSDILRFVGGRNVGTGHDLVEGTRAGRVWSDPLPAVHVEKVDQNNALIDLSEFNMGWLAELTASPDKLADTLARFPAAYLADFIAAQESEIAKLDVPRRREIAEMLIANQRAAHERMVAGVELLRSSRNAQLAFKAMNLAIKSYLENTRAIKKPGWRPFQLAFILLNLRGMTDKLSDDRAIVDLLFFPTGGGKTEAYLGLAAYQIALRRLENPEWLGSGVSVIMRYTLRLLTLDQLGRAAAMICALELLRRSDEWKDEHGQELLGKAPIEIGLWVGSGATPNKIGAKGEKDQSPPKNAYGKIEWHRRKRGGPPAPITECPWCGTAFDPDTYKVVGKRMLINCGNLECDFSAETGGLPVLAVDEEIYDRLPAFIVATVDKFAALPRRGEIGRFFDHVDRIESPDNLKHLTFYGADSPGVGKLLDPQRQCLPPPDLIIQDELHLISGPLGTVAGLYEAALERLASRKINGKLRGPKIIASTATVRRADDQIQKLFGRDKTAIFPPPGISRKDSYFAIVREDRSRQRQYFGISALGVGPRKVYLRTIVPLLAAAQKAFDEAPAAGEKNPADPYMTALCYFNALRELGATRRIVEDEVSSNLRDWNSRRVRSGQDESDSAFAGRKIGAPEELTSRDSTDKVAETKQRLALAFGAEEPKGPKPLDVALATNMISVGLDISRLGLMLVQNQPKSAAEYIQATSRVGRDDKKPGLVAVILNMHRARDRAHYEDFETYHQAFYRAVEATSVTPSAPGALDRALGAVFAGLVRHLDPELTPPRGAQAISVDHPAVLQARDFLSSRFACDAELDRLIAAWISIIADREGEGLNWDTYQPDDAGLMHSPLQDLSKLRDEFKLFEAGWSMRDVQPGVVIEIEEYLSKGA
ncbi:DISARM system helicase DrmA [Hyphobacterium sp.]|uniref:DISARM system helicase DrmA n=1 Tax=Hyphobacterium sp. TaxID=2004662 RepID=UPI003B52D7F7